MKNLVAIAAILAVGLSSCKKEDEENPFPVWILNVQVRDAINSSQPIASCARVIWNYSGSGDIKTVNCRDTNGYVKVWEHAEHTVTIHYRVECSGYEPSNDMSTTFHIDNASQLPGREGDEVIEGVTVYLYPN